MQTYKQWAIGDFEAALLACLRFPETGVALNELFGPGRRQTVSSALRRMTRRGLVTRVKVPTGKRGSPTFEYTRTAKGLAALHAFVAASNAFAANTSGARRPKLKVA